MKAHKRLRRAPSLRTRWGQPRGSAAVEFAVLAPLLFALLMGAIDVGQFVNVGQTVSDASREGARLAAQNEVTSSSAVQTAVLTFLGNTFPKISSGTLATATTITVKDSADNTVTDLTTISTGSALKVQVDLDFDYVRWAPSVGLGSNRTLSTTTVTRRE